MKNFTFWIASSSCPEGKLKVREIASRLEEEGGFWYDNFDWTVVAGLERTLEEVGINIERDLESARECDLFVFLNGPWGTSKGANIELGVRLGLNREAIYIDNGAGESDYFFYRKATIKTVAQLLEGSYE